MRGHGTYTKNDVLHASVAGVVQRVNKLISVLPPKTKYQGLPPCFFNGSFTNDVTHPKGLDISFVKAYIDGSRAVPVSTGV